MPRMEPCLDADSLTSGVWFSGPRVPHPRHPPPFSSLLPLLSFPCSPYRSHTQISTQHQQFPPQTRAWVSCLPHLPTRARSLITSKGPSWAEAWRTHARDVKERRGSFPSFAVSLHFVFTRILLTSLWLIYIRAPDSAPPILGFHRHLRAAKSPLSLRPMLSFLELQNVQHSRQLHIKSWWSTMVLLWGPHGRGSTQNTALQKLPRTAMLKCKALPRSLIKN